MCLDRIDAYKLMHEGTLALADVERAGIRVDMTYLHNAIKTTGETIVKLEQQLMSDPLWKEWRKLYGDKARLGSNQQLGALIFDRLGYERVSLPKEGNKEENDIQAFAHVDLDFVKVYFRMQQLKRAKGFFLEGILSEVSSSGFLHVLYNLNLVQTFRSSCEKINIQQVPVRNPEVAEIVRKAFIPRSGWQLGDDDFSGIEVGICACYHQDPTMLRYLAEGYDFHADWLCRIYKIPKKLFNQMPKFFKLHRYCAKNRFTFPEFYGSYYPDCAKALWHSIREFDLCMPDPMEDGVIGITLYQHLANNGITELGETDYRHIKQNGTVPGTFVHHIKEVEQMLWKQEHPVYDQWRRDIVTQYNQDGYIQTLTGFLLQGFMRRNDIFNYPPQGSAFHCLLWCLIQLNKTLRKYKMKTLIVAEVHDSMTKDYAPGELQNVMEITKDIMEVQLPKAWPWIVVPLKIESEVAPIDKSWHEKEAIAL